LLSDAVVYKLYNRLESTFLY